MRILDTGGEISVACDTLESLRGPGGMWTLNDGCHPKRKKCERVGGARERSEEENYTTHREEAREQ